MDEAALSVITRYTNQFQRIEPAFKNPEVNIEWKEEPKIEEYKSTIMLNEDLENEIIYDNWKLCETQLPILKDNEDKSPGLTKEFKIPDYPREVGIFLQLFDEELIKIVIKYTNIKGNKSSKETKKVEFKDKEKQDKENNKQESNDKDKQELEWKDVETEEMYIFLALTLLLPHCKKHQIYDYWKEDEVIDTPIFSKVMSRLRFYQILENLRFSDEKEEEEKDKHHLISIKNIFENIKRKFNKLFVPFNHQKQGEVTTFKGRMYFKQLLLSNTFRFDFKMFLLCDALTNTICDMTVYTSTKNINLLTTAPSDKEGSIEAILHPYLSKQEKKKKQKQNGFISKELETFAEHNNLGYLSKGRVHLSEQDQINIRTKEDLKKVKLNHNVHSEYIKDMRLIDVNDIQFSSVENLFNRMRWDKRMFFHLLDLSVYNSWKYYQLMTRSNCSLRLFSLNLIKQLMKKIPIEEILKDKEKETPPSKPQRLSDEEFIQLHHLSIMPPTQENKKNGKRKCYVCSHTILNKKQVKNVKTWCKECDVALCVGQCFIDYHTKEEY